METHEIHWEAYQQGYEKCKQVDSDPNKSGGNPYEKNTLKWKSWNKGWNAA